MRSMHTPYHMVLEAPPASTSQSPAYKAAAACTDPAALGLQVTAASWAWQERGGIYTYCHMRESMVQTGMAPRQFRTAGCAMHS